MPHTFGVEHTPPRRERGPSGAAPAAAMGADRMLAAGNRAVAALARDAAKKDEKKPEAPSGPHVIAEELGGAIRLLSYQLAPTRPGSTPRGGGREREKPGAEMVFTSPASEADRIMRANLAGTPIKQLDVVTSSGVMHLGSVYITSVSYSSAGGDEPIVSWTVSAQSLEMPQAGDERREEGE